MAADLVAQKELTEQLIKTMADLEEALSTVKTQGERIEAIEKQLDAATVISDARAKVSVYGDDEKVDRSLFKEAMTEDEVMKIMTSPTDDEMLKEAHEWADTIKMSCELLTTPRRTMLPEDLKCYPEYLAFCEKTGLGKALSNIGSPTSWVPEAWSQEIAHFYQQELRFATAFEPFDMPTGTFQWPFLGTGFNVVLVGEPTADPSQKVSSSQPSQTTITLTARTFGGRLVLSEELEEDMLASLLPMLRTNIIPRGMADATEDSLINGDTAGTHQDNPSGVQPASDSPKRAFLGVRADAIDETATYDVTTDSTAYAYSDFKEGLKQQNNGLGTNANEGVWVFSNGAYLDATDFAQVKDNPQLVGQVTSPVMNGVVNIIHGRPVIVSPKYPEDMNSTGVQVSGGTTTGFTHVNFRQYIIGRRRNETIDQVFDIETRQWKIVITQRMIFKKLLDSGNKSAASGVNVAA